MTFDEWYKQSGWAAFDDALQDVAQEAWDAGSYAALKDREGVDRVLTTKWMKIISVFNAQPSDEYFGKIVKEIINGVR